MGGAYFVVKRNNGRSMQKKHTIIFFFLILVVISLILLKNQNPLREEEIKIGAILALTGDAARVGEMERKGIELAVEELNSQGGINGKQVTLVMDDFGLDNARAVSLFHRFVEVEKVDFIIGPTWSDASFAIAPLADQRQIVSITPSASLLPEERSFVFSIWPSDSVAAQKLAEQIRDDRVKRLAILAIQNLWSENLSKNVSERFTQLGGSIVYSGVIINLDMRSELLKLQQQKPDAVYLAANVPEVAQYLKQAKELGVRLSIYGTDAIEDPELLKVAGELTDGIIYLWRKEARDDEFIKKFNEKYGEEPAMSAKEAYDAVMILAESLKHCEVKDSECVRKEIAGLNDFHGASGVFSMAESGFPEKEFIVKTIRDGKFVEVK